MCDGQIVDVVKGVGEVGRRRSWGSLSSQKLLAGCIRCQAVASWLLEQVEVTAAV